MKHGGREAGPVGFTDNMSDGNPSFRATHKNQSRAMNDLGGTPWTPEVRRFLWSNVCPLPSTKSRSWTQLGEIDAQGLLPLDWSQSSRRKPGSVKNRKSNGEIIAFSAERFGRPKLSCHERTRCHRVYTSSSTHGRVVDHGPRNRRLWRWNGRTIIWQNLRWTYQRVCWSP